MLSIFYDIPWYSQCVLVVSWSWRVYTNQLCVFREFIYLDPWACVFSPIQEAKGTFLLVLAAKLFCLLLAMSPNLSGTCKISLRFAFQIADTYFKMWLWQIRGSWATISLRYGQFYPTTVQKIPSSFSICTGFPPAPFSPQLSRQIAAILFLFSHLCLFSFPQVHFAFLPK